MCGANRRRGSRKAQFVRLQKTFRKVGLFRPKGKFRKSGRPRRSANLKSPSSHFAGALSELSRFIFALWTRIPKSLKALMARAGNPFIGTQNGGAVKNGRWENFWLAAVGGGKCLSGRLRNVFGTLRAPYAFAYFQCAAYARKCAGFLKKSVLITGVS